MQAIDTPSSVAAPTMLPPNLDQVARQDSLDLLWTFIPVTVALSAMTIVLAWSSLEGLSFGSAQPTAAVAAMPGASAALPAGHVERLGASALVPVIVKVPGGHVPAN